FSADGRYVVSSGRDRRVIVWDVERRINVHDILHPTWITAMDVSRRGEIATKCAKERRLRFYPLSNVHSEAPAQEAPLDEGLTTVNSLKYSEDGRWLAVLGEDKLQLRHATTKQVATDVAVDGGRRLAFSPDHAVLAVALKNRDVALLDLPSLDRRSTLSIGKPLPETDWDVGGNLQFSPDGRWLAWAGGQTGKRLVAWDLKEGGLQTIVEGAELGSEWIGQVQFTRDSTRLLSVGNDRQITIWKRDENAGQSCWVVEDSRRGHEGDIWSLAVSPDGAKMATASNDGTVRLWRTQPDEELGLRREFAGNQFVCQFRIGGELLHHLAWGGRYAIVRQADTLILCDTRSAALHTLPLSGSRAQVSADGNLVAVEEQGVVHLFRAQGPSRTEWVQVQGPEVAVDSRFAPWDAGFRFSPSQKYLALAKKDGGICVWSVADRSAFDLPTTFPKISDLAFSPDESLLSATSFRHLASACEVFDLRSRQRVSTVEGGPGAFSAARILPSQALVATADERASISLWKLDADLREAPPKRPVATFGEARAGLRAFTCSPDGRLLVTVGALDDQIHLWDTSTRQEMLTLSCKAPVWSLDFSPDGRTLTSACGVMVHRWEVPALDEIAATEIVAGPPEVAGK
ncbi:MAG: hypothetical protein AAF961_04695, partial [Planctomycetota bacterium]